MRGVGVGEKIKDQLKGVGSFITRDKGMMADGKGVNRRGYDVRQLKDVGGERLRRRYSYWCGNNSREKLGKRGLAGKRDCGWG